MKRPRRWHAGEIVTAQFSACRLYRYWLRVTWQQADLSLFDGRVPLGTLAVIGLNPSTADLQGDDQTMRKCVNWAKREHFTGLLMLNLFPFRATQPVCMKAAPDPYGDQADPQSLVSLVRAIGASPVVAAWGGSGDYRDRAAAVSLAFSGAGIPLFCIQKNRDGSPLHPCYAAIPHTMQQFNVVGLHTL